MPYTESSPKELFSKVVISTDLPNNKISQSPEIDIEALAKDESPI